MKKLAFRGAIAATILAAIAGIACQYLMSRKDAIDSGLASGRFDSLMQAYYLGIKLQPIAVALLFIAILLWISVLILHFIKRN